MGLLKSKHLDSEKNVSIGIDTWGLDFGLICLSGELLSNPYHYRDQNNDRMLEKVNAIIKGEEIYSRTGTQFLSVNSLYQLYAIKELRNHLFDAAETLLMIPDLIRYLLTGQIKSEVNAASTTQLFNPNTMEWDSFLIEELGFPGDYFLKLLNREQP
jgi:rhamnulokinase